MRPIQGIILDIDGTLLDSNDAHAQAWHEAISAHGHEREYEEVRKLIGMGGDQLLPALLSLSIDSEEGKAIAETRDTVFERDYLAGLDPFPEATTLVHLLAERGFSLTVASSSAKSDLRKFLKILEIGDVIDSKSSADDAEHSKPAPDLIEAALDKLGLSADEVIMIGDTPYDIAAAKKAGVHTVALRCGGWDDRALSGAAEIYDDPADLIKHIDRSPLFKPVMRVKNHEPDRSSAQI